MTKRVSPQEAHELLKQGWTYLDVRSTPEFTKAHPKGAVHVPFMEAGPGGLVPNPNFVSELEKRFEKDAKIVIGCESGRRSERAAAVMAEAGFTNVVDQRCGFGGSRDASGNVVEAGWRDAGLPVE